MNLTFTEEQRLLLDSVARFVQRDYSFAQRRAIVQSEARFSVDVWKLMAEFGWLGLSLPEAHGGLGGDAVDIGILMEGFGKGLVLEPFVSTVLLGGGLLARAGSAAQQAEWLPRIAAGEVRLAFAHSEPSTRYEAAPASATAKLTREGWWLDGKKCWVMDAPRADALIVSATLAGRAGGGVGLFLLPGDTPGLRLTPYPTVDGRLGANLELHGVMVSEDAHLSGVADARAVIDETLDRAVAAGCAESIGCIRELLDQTVDYSKTRVQFGQPLAVNQALRHRMVDMAVSCEEARALALRASLHLDRPADERARAVSGAKIKVARAARFVSEGAIQIHGAMGVTDELNVGTYVKRLLAIEMTLGTPADHQRRLVALRARAGGPSAFV